LHSYHLISKEFHQLAKDDSVWKKITLRRFPNMSHSPYLNSIKGFKWKKLYKEIYGNSVVSITTCLMLDVYKTSREKLLYLKFEKNSLEISLELTAMV